MHGFPFSDLIDVDVLHRRIPTRISGRGLPILFLHGYPLDSRMWGPLVHLLASDYLCIAPDLRGFGRGPEQAMSFSMSQLADDCALLLDTLQIRQPVVVCGLSMGGYVAMQMAERHKHRIAAMILTNTRANADDPAAAKNRHAVALKALKEGGESVVLPMLNKLLSVHTQSHQPEVVELVRSMMLATCKSTIAWAQMAMAAREDFLARLSDWTMPVTCVAGSEDSIVPEQAMRQMAKELGGSELRVVANTAHMTPLECPAEFAEIVRKSTSTLL